MALTFWGEPRDHHAYDHAHESPLTMTLPLMVLALGSLFWGFWGVPEAFGGHFAVGEWLKPALTYGQTHAAHGHHEGPAVLLAVISTGLGLGFGFLGWKTFRNGPAPELAFAAKFPFVHNLLLNKYYVDEAYNAGVVQPIRVTSEQVLWKVVDVAGIDGAVNGTAESVGGLAELLRRVQTGSVRAYAASLLLGAVMVFGYYLWR